jgi:hypothetical protein
VLKLENEVANGRLHRRHEDRRHDSEHVKATWHSWAGERDRDIKCRGRCGLGGLQLASRQLGLAQTLQPVVSVVGRGRVRRSVLTPARKGVSQRSRIR